VGDQGTDLAEIGRMGQHAKSRTQRFSSGMPCDWNPFVIENPDTGMPFSDASAWEMICRLLKESPEIFRSVRLQKPAGLEAFETVVELPSRVRVYIKVQLFQGKAHGRSFHISTKE
jgi:hypothetical protein